MMLRTSTSHEEGCNRQFSILTKEFHGDADGYVQGLVTVSVEWTTDASGRQQFHEVPGSQQECPANWCCWPWVLSGRKKGGHRAVGPGARRPRQRQVR